MTFHEDQPDDRRLADLLRSIDRDVPDADPQALEEIKQRSAAEFAAQGETMQTATPEVSLGAPFVRERAIAPGKFVPWSIAIAAGIALALVTYQRFAPRKEDPPPAFGQVLLTMARADSLELEVTRADRRGQVWVQGDRMRWDKGEGVYQVAAAERLWNIDEKENRIRAQNSPYYESRLHGINLVALLGSELSSNIDNARARNARPVARGRHDGVDCHVYRVPVVAAASSRRNQDTEAGSRSHQGSNHKTAAGSRSHVQIEAFVEAATGRLRAIEAWTVEQDRRRDLGRVVVVAMNPPVDENLFTVGDTLTEDGRVGRVTDVQGIVSLRPVMGRRWSPVPSGMLLKPGDWVRTDIRGANAVALELVKQGAVTLGPGTTLEVVNPQELRLLHGQVQVEPADGRMITLTAGDDVAVDVETMGVYRRQADGGKLARLAAKPLWLQGFEGTTTQDPIGSLVANVDGRDVPLTVGYHKVKVDIRDQIARTVIEESFVNHTDGRLEGVFYFPLPQDASISGFGMWIGGELIEADVVEKQRAREIYETILRERRDPALLEWSGGNLFKARVFPIEAHSEKRIKITYTQVLPMRRDQYRYHYALQSEMLRQHPLRELAIDVTVSSAVPLKEVHCQTHTTRTDVTKHAAHVEFTAQEYTPSQDFELVVEVDGSRPDVAVIPHRRGEDGYFMLQLIPPGGTGSLQRELLPDGDPLDILLLADTSASLDRGARELQQQVIVALTAALSPQDTINVATCDVDCHWLFKKKRPADEKTTQQVRDFVAQRRSLGWSDLDKAFDAVMRQTGPNTHVVYVGDGIVSTTAADPVAFGRRLRRMYAQEDKGGALHAIAVSSTYEPLAMKAIAALGGGSFRQVTDAQQVQPLVQQLLGEIAQPVIRDLAVEFRGVRTARVYPQELPNLVGGTQQIVLGRYLPEGEDQTGEVIVTGTLNGKPVRYRAEITLRDAEQGNSFIPRLWARMHLDQLLEQGSSQSIQDEIIALSEEYHIITPYTSLLVLESDADRERFKVKRRFLMRDGERFFAEGRAGANYELVQQQMRRAGNWRLGLRRRVLQKLVALGRDLPIVPQLQPQYALDGNNLNGTVHYGFIGAGSGGGGFGISNHAWFFSGDEFREREGRRRGSWRGDGRPDGEDFLFEEDEEVDGDREDLDRQWAASNEELDAVFADADLSEIMSEAELSATETPEPSEPLVSRDWSDITFANGRLGWDRERRFEKAAKLQYGARSSYLQMASEIRQAETGGNFWTSAGTRFAWGQQPYYGDLTQSLSTLFPPVPSTAVAKTVKSDWPQELQDLAASLLRWEALQTIEGGLAITRTSKTFDVRRDRPSGVARHLMLYSPGAWVMRTGSDGGQTIVSWCDDARRGRYSESFGLGRVRNSVPADLKRPPLSLSDYSLHSLAETYAVYKPSLKELNEARVELTLQNKQNKDHQFRFEIDTGRRVVLSFSVWHKGKQTTKTTFGDFVEVGDCWWAGTIKTQDAEGRRTSLVRQTVEARTAEEFSGRMNELLADRDAVALLQQPPPGLAAAKQSAAAGTASLDDQMTLLVHFANTQQWERVREHLAAFEKLAGGKPGTRWVRYAVDHFSRQREPLRKALLAEADRLVDDTDNYFLAQYVWGQAASYLQADEMLALLERLRPVYFNQPAHMRGELAWRQQQASYLASAGQQDAALAAWKSLSKDYPDVYNIDQQYAQQLANRGNYEDAYRVLSEAIDNKDRLTYERDSLRSRYAQLLANQSRYDELSKFCRAWIKEKPAVLTPYSQLLGALVVTDRQDEAHRLIAEWLTEGRKGKMSDAAGYRFQAAVIHAVGQGNFTHTGRVDPQWIEPLADVVEQYGGDPGRFHLLSRIMTNGTFQQTDACRRVRAGMVKQLTENLDSLTPTVATSYIDWIWPNDPAVERPTWQMISDALDRRWIEEDEWSVRGQWAAPLVKVLQHKVGANAWLAFLRRQLDAVDQPQRHAPARQLLDAVLQQPWQQELEDEAFALLGKLPDSNSPDHALTIQVQSLYRIVDRMITARYDASMAEIEHLEDLTRTEQRTKRAENLRLARTALADRLRNATDKHGSALAPWLQVERMYLDVQLGRHLAEVADECWGHLDNGPRDGNDAEAVDWLTHVLRSRHLATVTNLACRRDAAPELAQRLLDYVERGADAPANQLYWRQYKYDLLVALDRPKQLEAALRGWIAEADEGAARVEDRPRRAEPTAITLDELAVHYWRVALGYLLAEQGMIADAITLLETVRDADELSPSDYRSLADWYLVVDRRDDHRKAKVAMYKTMSDNALYNYLNHRLQPWRQRDGELPDELDENVLLVFEALFAKSPHPQNYLRQLREFYTASRDFRLLAGLGDAVLGHTAGQVYPFLQQMHSVLSEVRDEATADSIVERIATARERAKSATDWRALDLLELLVERRASEVLNQPGPHEAKALAAMRRAFDRNWTEGEPRLMAELLASLGTISGTRLAAEQQRQLQELFRTTQTGSLDRLQIAHAWARTSWGYGKHDEAIDRLHSELTAYQAAIDAPLPSHTNGTVGTLVSYLEQRDHYQRAETFLLSQLEHDNHPQQQYWYTLRLYDTYNRTLDDRGVVSLGQGDELYQAAAAAMIADLSTDDDNHRYQLIQKLCQFYRTAHRRKIQNVANDLRRFAAQAFPKALDEQTDYYPSMVGTVADTLHDLAAPRDALAFLIDRVENEPDSLRQRNQDGWSQHNWRLGRWRTESEPLGKLEPRLLAIVLDALRRDLTHRQQRNRSMYARHNSRFWTARQEDFAGAAEQVYRQHQESGAAVLYIAEYLYHGLGLYDRAIEIMWAAHRAGRLDEGGQSRLVYFLHDRSKFADSISVLRGLVELRPDNINYRTQLMFAFFRTDQIAPLLEVLQQADDYFHQASRWQEGPMAALASSCLRTNLYEQSVAYYKELIPLHQRSHAGRGIGNGTLSGYYANMARAYSGLKNTDKSVDAASGAIVSWGRDLNNRRAAMDALKNVLMNAHDLDDYVVRLDRDTEKTGLDKPIVRKGLGQVYLEKRMYDKAIAQLRLAIDVQPNDTETHQALIACYDQQNDRDGAIGTLFAMVDLRRRDIQLYKDLASRLRDKPAQMERACTSIVEVLPNESESHAMLAEIRQNQNRWDDAIAHWQRVAELRKLEPTGLLRLAEAQFHQGLRPDAMQTLDRLTSQSWPDRFGDVHQQAHELRDKINK